MKRTDIRLRICAALMAVNILFIWGNSLLPGEVSAAVSGWVKELLRILFGGSPGGSSGGDGLLRKLAHLTEFALLGALGAWLFSMLEKTAWAGFFIGFPVACVDETIQCFIPDRGPGLRDVLIDTVGVCLGIGLLLLGHTIYKKTKNFGGNET